MVVRSGDKFLGGIWVYSQPILFLEEVKKKGSRENLLSFFYDKKFRRNSSKKYFLKNFEKGIDFSKKSDIIIITKGMENS